MTYYIIADGHRDMTLFLIDRSRNKKHWWSYSTYDALEWLSKKAAEKHALKYRYKNVRVVERTVALQLEERNDRFFDYDALEHPFSSDALGQS
jgi:hypothetical protein